MPTIYPSKGNKPKSQANKPKSAYEAQVMTELRYRQLPFQYEGVRLLYLSEYRPDILLPNGILVELKGYFTPDDRHKAISARKCNPTIDLRFLFQRDSKLSSKGSTRYSDWCVKHGFKFAIGKTIPIEWYKE